MNKKKLYWSLQLGGWTFYVMVQLLGRALSVSASSEQNIVQAAFLVAEGVLFLITTHYTRYIIKRLNWIKLSMVRLIPRVLLIVVILGLILFFLRVLVSIPIGEYDPSVLRIVNILGLSAVFSLIYFIWMVLYFTYHYFIEYNTALKHEAAIKEIELNNLKSQLNPHFIFNSLNSIRALVDENPANSKVAITQLSNILRNSLVSDKDRLIPLKDELAVVKDYLGLERIRYEERLKVSLDIDPASNHLMVPPLMIQTLVENGIKHGISKLKTGGEMMIKTSVKPRVFIIEIINSGTLEDNSKVVGTGMGIENTKKRLNLIFGDEAKFSIKNGEDKRVITQLSIPKREEL